MKVTSTATAALLLAGGASAYNMPTRSTLRSLGHKSVSFQQQTSSSVSRGPSKGDMKMEDFGLLKGSSIGFEDLWGGEEVICETALERRLNKDGLRFRMNRTPQEADEVGVLGGGSLPGATLNLPIIGETYIGPPKVASIWEALGFTATSNNEARQLEKKKAIEKCRTAKSAARGSWLEPNEGKSMPESGADLRAKWLEKYGYPRLVGSGGIFYADQLSTDKEPSGGFNMGKSGSIWPVPKVVKEGQYGGVKGWGMKKAGPAVDGLPKAKL